MARRGRRGEGSVYFSKTDRRWVARFPLGVVDGVRQSKRVKCRTRDEAEDELDKLRRAYGAGSAPANGTLGAYLDAWLPRHARSIRESTAISYAGHARLHIKPLLGGIPLVRLQPNDVYRLIEDLERKRLSAGTIHLVIRTLSVALQAAVDGRTLSDNATRGVKLPRLDKEPVAAITEEDVERIYAATHDTWLEFPVRVWMGSGLRRGEVLGLDQRDVGEGFVTVRVSKTSVRAVPVTEDAMVALRQAIHDAPRHGPNEPVFFGPRTGDRMPGASITHALVKLAGLSPHKLRHGVATRMVARGVHMRTVAEQLGHRNPALTARVYSHIVPQQQVDAIRHLDRRQAR